MRKLDLAFTLSALNTYIVFQLARVADNGLTKRMQCTALVYPEFCGVWTMSDPEKPSPPSDVPDRDGGTQVLTRPKEKTQKPSLYKVIILNDDFTPMEFVVNVLERVFHLAHEKAFEIMLQVHLKGSAVVGVYTYEVAETKVATVLELARRSEHPLQCRMEKE